MKLSIVDRPSFTVVGLQIHTVPMSPEIPALWQKFVPRLDEIENPAEPRVSYGVMRQGPEGMASLEYLAAVSVREVGDLPLGMVSLTLPAGAYARFAYPLSGLAAGFGEIFGQLLPSSDHVQRPGPYFERYGTSFDPGDPSSIVEVYLPVSPRTGGAGQG